jgi:hypothetical protein
VKFDGKLIENAIKKAYLASDVILDINLGDFVK